MSAAKRWQTLGKILRRGALFAAAGLACLYLILSLALSTRFVAVRVSHLLSDYLHQPVFIASLQLSAEGLSIRDLHVAQPPGFAGTDMVAVRSVTVKPVWSAFLRGEKRFRAIELEGLRLDVGKNGQGEWNVARLKHLAAGRKPSAEMFVRRLTLRDAAIRVNGRGVDNLNLTVNDLATKGSTAGGVTIDGRDDTGNPFHLEGRVRLGATPDGRIHLHIASLPLASFARYLKKGSPLAISEGSARLDADAVLAGGELTLEGSCAISRLRMRAAGGYLPVDGTLQFSGSYSIPRDEAHLALAHLTVNEFVHLRGSGNVFGVKGEGRRFVADLSLDGFEAGELFRRLPVKLQRDLRVTGKVEGANAHLEGDGKGLTAAVATLRARGWDVWRKETLLCRGVGATFSLGQRGTGWAVQGRLDGRGAGGLVEELSLPVNLRLARGLDILEVAAPALSAKVGGISVRGEARFERDAPVPWQLRLVMPRSSVVNLQRYVPPGRLTLAGGTAAGELVLGGASPGRLAGKGHISFEGVKGAASGKNFSLRKGSITAVLARMGEDATAEGHIVFVGGEYAGKRFDAESDYGWRGGNAFLRRGQASLDRHTLRVATIDFPVPRETPSGSLPLSFSFSGVEVTSGDLHAVRGEGRLAVTRFMTEGKTWLEGEGTATIGALSFRTTSLGPAAVKLILGRDKGSVTLSATTFGGSLAATMVADPADLAKGLTFTARGDGLDGARVGVLAGIGKGWRIVGGRLDGTASGSYAATAGVRATGLVRADGLNISSPGGKSAITGASLLLDARVDGPDLHVARAALTLPGGLSLEGGGEMARFAAADRAGTFTVAMTSVPIGTLFDDFANLLPRPLQEASAGGSASMQAKVAVTGRSAAVDGSLLLADAALDIPSRKMSLSDVHGRVPFSIDTSGKPSLRRRDILTFSRDNYPLLVQQMEKPAGGEDLTVGRARFGPLEIVSSRFAFRAEGGITELTAFDVPFFGG
ncbi:MAG TPA: DUF748 domain-containing protein, partial [Geobacteraceae bacterium]